MKRIAKLFAFLAFDAVLLCCAAGCGTDTLTTKAKAGISAGIPEGLGEYDSVAYYSLADQNDVEFTFEIDEVQKVSFMYRVIDSDAWSLDKGTMTVDASVFDGITAGDKRLRVFADDVYVEIVIRAVTKVIYTVAEFNSIREDMNGTYVLGADIDFGNVAFWPIGKPYTEGGEVSTFEGTLDGQGHTIRNLKIDAYDYSVDESHFTDGGADEWQGPSLGNRVENGSNYNNGIFMTTSANAQIENVNFINITVDCQGLSGPIVGTNGGHIRNCFISCTLSSHADWSERVGGIVGMNGTSESAGVIENCVVYYTLGTGRTPRGFADWNVGIIRNCYAAPADNYIYLPGFEYDEQTGTGAVPSDFDINTYITTENIGAVGFGYYNLPALPGSFDSATQTYYPAGENKILNAKIVRKEVLLDPANFPAEEGWDSNIWEFSAGTFPRVKVQA